MIHRQMWISLRLGGNEPIGAYDNDVSRAFIPMQASVRPLFIEISLYLIFGV